MKKNMKRNCLFCCFLVCFLFTCAILNPVCHAEENLSKEPVTVRDDASLLMEEEADWLKSIAQGLSEKSGWNVIVATCADATGRTAQTTCEEYFNTYTTGNNGICCLVDMANREIYISTAGEAISCLTDDKIDKILDQAQKAASENDYAQCLYLMLLGADEAYEAGGTEKKISFAASIAAIGAVFAVVFVRHFSKKKRGRTDAPASDQMAYRAASRAARRNWMRRSTAVRSRSSVHIGSGGRKFGGRGRKF